MTGLPKNLFNKIKQMIFQYTSSQRSDIAALQTAVGDIESEYKEYVATVSQSGTGPTDAPNPTVLKNTLGGTLVWSRTGAGNYLATLTGAFPNNNKVVIFSSFTYSNLNPLNDVGLLSYGWNDANSLYFTTANMDNTGARTIADDVMYHTLIIRVYP